MIRNSVADGIDNTQGLFDIDRIMVWVCRSYKRFSITNINNQ
ncbi:MAG: hypothetical protein QW416_01020 [Candidatus Nitrosocaldaceae archaeon]